ncbi:putative wall-associated receptor kinase-like 11 isoform X2 [Amaranthus tricolor]|uniref:putative wall-associated receptor kinase-like 11 isoform X2 n=1 Tax=Amaranthus tricolor TaxID=29722 RepID=UPI002588044F|nr:putative wall-associated receptor kinase-like 11 isoform X2 [Amaranthus tricolor]
MKLGAITCSVVAHHHQGWRFFTSILSHIGLVQLLDNILSLLLLSFISSSSLNFTNFHLPGEFGIKVNNKGTNGSCRSAFLISKKYLEAGTPLTASGTIPVPVVLVWGDPFDQSLVEKYGIVVAISSVVGASLATCGCCWGLWRLKTKRRREEHKLRKKYFIEKLDEQGFSNRESTEKIKIFTLSELKRYTDNFNKNRVLGLGGQGTIYKGMLKDGKVIAVKRSKSLDQNQWKPFINEIILLSQIKHRHVVKILGCCLEGNIPFVVYEYISNGTLSELIHNSITVNFIFTWEIRLRIAYETATAIDYLHVGFPTPIYHRDIKSSNILLDDKFRAKLSDFGISRVVGIDHSHLSTCVQGTFGYLDPEYFYSSQYTEKSDVYSFGVILIELLTGQKPIRPLDNEEEEDRSLVEYFISSMNESTLFNIVDPIVLEGGKPEDIINFSNIAKSCLNPIRQERPTMKEVTMGLEGLWCLRSLSMNKISEATTRLNDQISDWRIKSSSSTFSEIDNASFRAITFDNIDLNITSCSKEVEMRLLHTN